MNKFVLFTDPVSAWEPRGGVSIGAALESRGLAVPVANNPVVIIADGDGQLTLCIAHEPEPRRAFSQAGIDAVGQAILRFIDPIDYCFVLFHTGSEYDPGRHDAQANIFAGHFLFWKEYRHANAAPYSLFCEAISEPAKIQSLLLDLTDPEYIAEQIKQGAQQGPLIPQEADMKWKELEAVHGGNLIQEFQDKPCLDHDELCCRLNSVTMGIVNRAHI